MKIRLFVVGIDHNVGFISDYKKGDNPIIMGFDRRFGQMLLQSCLLNLAFLVLQLVVKVTDCL